MNHEFCLKNYLEKTLDLHKFFRAYIVSLFDSMKRKF